MAFDPNLSTLTDKARLRLGDTVDPPLIPEASYTATLNSGLSYNEALAQLAEALGAYWLSSEGTEVTLGDQKVKSGGKSKYYFDLAKNLRASAPTDGIDTSYQSGATGSLPEPCPNVLDRPYDPCCASLVGPYSADGCLL